MTRRCTGSSRARRRFHASARLQALYVNINAVPAGLLGEVHRLVHLADEIVHRGARGVAAADAGCQAD